MLAGATMNDEFVALVRTYLEPALVLHGFAAGQGGEGRDSTQIIFCSASDEFFERFGHTDFPGGQPPDAFCMDITTEAVLTDRWHATGITLNGVHYATPDLPKESLEAEVQYIADRFLPMLTGDAPVEWAPRDWRPLRPTRDPEFMPRSIALATSEGLASDAASLRMFGQWSLAHPGQLPLGPFSEQNNSRWKRFVIAMARAAEIRLGKFPK